MKLQTLFPLRSPWALRLIGNAKQACPEQRRMEPIRQERIAGQVLWKPFGFIRNTILYILVFYACFSFWPIVTILYVVSYEAFLLDKLFGCGKGRSPRLRQVNSWLI